MLIFYTFFLKSQIELCRSDGTRVELVCEVKAGGLKKLMLPLVVSILKKEDGDHLQRLKKALEG